MFPRRQPREWHQTEGFREEALCLEASKRSYRDTTAHLNRYRRQLQGGTPVTTLQANAQQEGARVLDFLEQHSQAVLQGRGFDAQGRPSEAAVAAVEAGADSRLEAATVAEQLTAVCQEMAARGLTPVQIAAARSRAAKAVYEDPTQCVNVAVDDVEVKKQKAHRQRRTPRSQRRSSPWRRRSRRRHRPARIRWQQWRAPPANAPRWPIRSPASSKVRSALSSAAAPRPSTAVRLGILAYQRPARRSNSSFHRWL